MPRRYFNWKLASAILLSILVIAITLYGIRQWRRTMRAESGLSLGEKAYKSHNYEEASRQFGRYLSVYPNDVNALLKYADSQMKNGPIKSGNIQQAIAAYRSVLRLDEANSNAASEITGLYLSIGQAGEAELIAKRYCESQKDPKIRKNLALAYAAQSKFEQAVKELKSIIAEDPTQVSAYEMLGQIVLQRPKEVNEAADYWFNQAIKNNPSSAIAYIARAGFYRSTNNQAKALADLQQAQQMDLSDVNVRLRLAIEFINAGNFEQAEMHLSEIKKSEPQNQLLWQSWAQLALKSGSTEKMRQTADAGLKELAEQKWDFIPLAAELFIRSGDFTKAEECIKQMQQKEILPDAAAFLDGLMAYRKEQDYEAVKCWQRSIKLGNKSSQTRLMLASAFSHLGDNQSALRQLKTLVSETPNLPEAHFALATQLAQVGQWTEAEEQSKKTLLLSPGHLGAALLNLRARSRLLTISPAGQDAKAWQNIERELAALDQASNGALNVKLVRFQCALMKEDLTTAESVLSELKQMYPSDSKVILADASFYSIKGNPEKSLSVLSEAIKKSPQATELLGYYISLLVGQKKFADCEQQIKEVSAHLDSPSARKETGILLSQIYSLWGKQELTYDCLAGLEKQFPQDISVKRQLLLCKKNKDNPQQSQQLIDSIKSIEGENGWQWRYEQAILWYQSGDFGQKYPQIVSILKENLLTNPDDNYSRILLAETYNKAQDFRLAASIFKEALSNWPQDIRLIVKTATALQKANEYTQADEILAQAANEKLFNPELRRLELQSHLLRGELKPAGEILEDMLADDPNNSQVCLSLASFKIQQHQYADAEELLTRLRSFEPDLPAAIEVQAELYVRQNKGSDAIAMCDQLVKKSNDAQAYLLRGKIYAMLSQTEMAAKDFEQATIIEPKNIQTWVAKTDFERSVGRLENAVSDVRHAITLEPNNLQIRKRAISLYMESPNPNLRKDGIKLLGEVMQANPNDYQLRLLKVRSLLAEINYPAIKQAEAILRSITEEKPSEREAWILLGEILLRYEQEPSDAIGIALKGLAYNHNDKALLMLKARGEAILSPTSAIVTLRGLLEQEPNNIDAALMLGETFLTIGQPQNAVAFLRKQLPVYGGTPYERDTNMLLAKALYKSGEKNNAEEILNTLYMTDANDPRVLLTHIRLLKDDKLWDQIRQKVAIWYQRHPENKRAVVTIAGELVASGNEQAGIAAEDILNLILKDDPASTEALGVLGMLFSSRGQSSQATSIYQRLLELMPDNVITMNNLAWILCGQGQYEHALELAQKGLKIAPNYTDLLDTRGLIYSQMGNVQEAISDFNRCIELYLPNATSRTASYFHLAKAFYKLQEKAKAVDILKQAIKLNEKIGGLSPAELTEGRNLLEEMSRGE
jgi:pentatricopeptide repeat protein